MRIGIVGDGLVASVFKGLQDCEVVHRNEWQPIRWDGLVNCAAMSSRARCEGASFVDVMRANTWMPLQMRRQIDRLNRKVKFIQFSTCAIYKHPADPDDLISENHPLFPLHSYGASKILMEMMLENTDTYIFRIPRVVTGNGHKSDLDSHIANWTQVEDRNASIVRGETIIKAVKAVMEEEVPTGVYNLATEIIHLPSFIKENYGWEGEVVPADSMKGLGPWPVLDTTKGEMYGIL